MERLPDHRQHVIGPLQDLVIPKAQRANAFDGKKRITIRIVGALRIFIVTAAVELDRKVSLDAEEIQHVTIGGVLPAKLEAAKAARAKL